MNMGIKINECQKNEYRKKGYWGDATLADYWQHSVLRAPEKTAVIDWQGTSYTYAELNENAGRLASYLIDIGVEPGDIVSLQIPGWSEFTLIYIACLKVGAIVNPILPSLREAELTYILTKCESKVLFIPSIYRKINYPSMIGNLVSNVPSLKEVVVVEKEVPVKEGTTLCNVLSKYSPLEKCRTCSADDVAVVLFTSGTEGFPKGVMLTHNNIIASEKAFAGTLNLTYLDTIFMPSPLAHASGFHHGVTISFLIGAKCVLQDKYNPENSLELIERERCTCANASTPLVYDILYTLEKKKCDTSSLRFILCGGSPIPRHMLKQSLAAGFKLIGVYGSTESVPHSTVRLEDSCERIINTDGTAVPGVEIKVVDELRNTVQVGVQGEEASRGPSVFVGYLKEPELTALVLDEDGWYYSGDLCTMDEHGYIRINGRKKDIIIRGGENISSTEIEDILLNHPNVRDVAVVGMPDPRLGERVCAYVVLKFPEKGITLDDLKTFFLQTNVAKYKIPERIEVIKCIPRNENCKIKKYILREDIKIKLKEDNQDNSFVI